MDKFLFRFFRRKELHSANERRFPANDDVNLKLPRYCYFPLTFYHHPPPHRREASLALVDPPTWKNQDRKIVVFQVWPNKNPRT